MNARQMVSENDDDARDRGERDSVKCAGRMCSGFVKSVQRRLWWVEEMLCSKNLRTRSGTLTRE
jgi:hypothetical protein